MATAPITDLFRQNLRALMEHHGITPYRLESVSGVARTNIRRILDGEENISLERADRLASAAGCSLIDLLSPRFSPKKFHKAS